MSDLRYAREQRDGPAKIKLKLQGDRPNPTPRAALEIGLAMHN
jgi:hypothetical protein